MTDPEAEGLPDTADDTTTAYDQGTRPRFEDSPAALPVDEPLGIDEFGVTAEEARRGEPLAARLLREEPEVGGEAAGDAAGVGRLVGPDEGGLEVTEAQLVGRDTGETGGMSAEEAAVHEVPGDDAPGRV